MSSPQFTLYSHAGGPNGWKVAYVLKALGLTYETKFLDFSENEQKGPEYTAINPNGRIPALVDHAENFTVWESGAILVYLVEKYDTEFKLSFASAKEKTLVLQWLFFQASGQGPYFGQAAHFLVFAPEKIPYAIDRYKKEVARVSEVLNGVLAKQPFLVGGRVSIADLAFVSWNNGALQGLLPEGVDPKKEFSALVAWHEKLTALPYVKEAMEEKAALATPH